MEEDDLIQVRLGFLNETRQRISNIRGGIRKLAFQWIEGSRI